MSAPELRLDAAGLRLAYDRPYLATALWSLRRVARPGLGTLGVDKAWRLYYDPEAVLRWEADVLAGVLYHEICHLLRDHAGRGEPMDDSHLWNIATDAEINDDLRAEHVHLPEGAIYPDTLQLSDGQLAEAYYRNLITSRAAGDCELVHGTGGPSIGSDVYEGRGPTAGSCGSIATGRLDAWAQPIDGDGLSDIEAELVRHTVAQAVLEHVRSAGSAPAHLGRWAETRDRPHVDWRRELASAVRAALGEVAGAVDYRYNRPSRRQASYGSVIMPSLRQPVPRVAVVVDTSGSMSQALLDTALAEISGILRAAGQRDGVQVLAVDAAVHASTRVFRTDQVVLAGGGGTNMGVGLAAVGKLRPRPEIAVVVTDGFTPWPKQPPPGVRTVVVRLDPRGAAPPWARCIDVVPGHA